MDKKRAIAACDRISILVKGFCPTGAGGGIDNSCGRGGSSGKHDDGGGGGGDGVQPSSIPDLVADAKKLMKKVDDPDIQKVSKEAIAASSHALKTGKAKDHAKAADLLETAGRMLTDGAMNVAEDFDEDGMPIGKEANNFLMAGEVHYAAAEGHQNAAKKR